MLVCVRSSSYRSGKFQASSSARLGANLRSIQILAPASGAIALTRTRHISPAERTITISIVIRCIPSMVESIAELFQLRTCPVRRVLHRPTWTHRPNVRPRLLREICPSKAQYRVVNCPLRESHANWTVVANGVGDPFAKL